MFIGILDKMLVSIIIPCYNYGSYIKQTLESAVMQSYGNIEIIVVDDGSTDSTREVVLDVAQNDPRIKYFYQNNKGLSAARNTGIQHSKGDYIQFLDADDLLSKEKLNTQINHFSKDSSLGISYTNAYYFANDAPEKLYKTLELTNQEWMPKLTGDQFLVWKALIEYNIMPVNAALLKRCVIDKVGLFNEALRSLEDWEYWLRCSVIGKIAFVDDEKAFAMIRVHKTSMSQNRARMLTLEIGIRSYIQKLIKSLKLTTNQEIDLTLQNNKKIKRLVAIEISNQGFFNFKAFGYLIKQIGLKNFMQGYVKAANDFRKS